MQDLQYEAPQAGDEATVRRAWRQLDASPVDWHLLSTKRQQSNFRDHVIIRIQPRSQTTIPQAFPGHELSRLALASVI